VIELRSRDDVTGRGRTCDAPRFKRALYRLSYGHVNGRSRARTGGLLLIREALCQLSYPPSTSLVCPAPRWGVRRTCGRSDTFAIKCRDVGVSPTKLSMPLAYPSTLDRSPAAASYVEGCWSPVLAQCHCKSACKSNTYIYTRNKALQRRGPFSLKRGLKCT
jgi:hypothetical protein